MPRNSTTAEPMKSVAPGDSAAGESVTDGDGDAEQPATTRAKMTSAIALMASTSLELATHRGANHHLGCVSVKTDRTRCVS